MIVLTVVHCEGKLTMLTVENYHAANPDHNQGFQSADSIHAINLLTSGLFTVNTMWTD